MKILSDVIVFERFADFLEKKERFKKTYVHKVINQGVYQPQEDYYLRLRQKLISLFRKHSSLDELDEILKKITPKKFAVTSTSMVGCTKLATNDALSLMVTFALSQFLNL